MWPFIYSCMLMHDITAYKNLHLHKSKIYILTFGWSNDLSFDPIHSLAHRQSDSWPEFQDVNFVLPVWIDIQSYEVL